ncbi:MAG: hypothetical protein CSA62_01995 [Planctomycetota bacterium]|nr:MAG: hypothetical protein CSA62_01995 [Planctomycetota bacterium]
MFGRQVELVLIPNRAKRANAPIGQRPPFVSDCGSEIRSGEARWSQGPDLVLTPNLWPFYSRQALLWSPSGFSREPSVELLGAGLSLAQGIDATVLHNTIGAAASIPMGHLHLVDAAPPFLRDLSGPVLLSGSGFELVGLPEGLPLHWLGVRAEDPLRRAQIGKMLLDRRTTAAANLVAHGELLWVIPRRSEQPEPHFPYALGAAELGGRWVFQQAESFERACSAALEQALVEACVPRIGDEWQLYAGLLEEFAG